MTVCWRVKNKFSKFVSISMLWIFLIFALSGCNTVPLADSGAPIGASGLTPTAEPARENLRLISAQGGPIFTGISGTKNGGYEIFAHTDATADIIYYDYQTLQKIYLSSSPNETHNENSTAYLDNVMGGAVALASEKCLYILKAGSNAIGGGTDLAPYLLRMDLDGSNRERFDIPGQYELDVASAVAADDTGLYIALHVIEDLKTDQSRYMIAKVDFDHKKLEELYRFDPWQSVRIVGTYSYGLILESVKNIKSGTAIQKETLLFNLNSNQAKTIKEWKAGDVGVAYDRDAMYLLKSDDLTLYRSALYPDSAGPEEKVIDCTDLIPDTYTGIALDRAVYDRHLIFQITSEQSGAEPLYLSLALDGLETREMRLMCKRNGEEQLATIMQETDTHFVVYYGEKAISYLDKGPGGEPYEMTQYVPSYRLIEKTAYWENIPDFMAFENHVLK